MTNPTPLRGEAAAMSPEEIAENIIKFEGVIFAMALAGDNKDDMREARDCLKAAIVRAITAERRKLLSLDSSR